MSDAAPHPPLWRQLLSFGVVGGLQLLLDWAVFVAMTALGLAAVPANLAGRVSGACLGFWLNGQVTFRRAGQAMLGAGPLRRFLAMWLGLTVASSAAIWAVNKGGGLQLAWIAKPAIEAVLAVVSFIIARRWVYR